MQPRVVEVADPDVVRQYLALDPEVHLYGLADLEDPIWSLSRWFIRERDGAVSAAVGIVGLPDSDDRIFYAQGRAGDDEVALLSGEIASEIPHGCLATLAHGVEPHLTGIELQLEGEFQRMILRDRCRIPDCSQGVSRVGVEALPAMRKLIADEQNANMFLGPAMFDEVDYRVVWDRSDLVAMAGVHVFSERHGVAAIGNVLTASAHRRKGLATRVVGDLAAELHARVELVGLNHRVTNLSARRCYEQLGFESVHTYVEGRLLRA
ncbi:MAG: GNAT family N-acetyltransferase [Acidimicrobiales bacterium]